MVGWHHQFNGHELGHNLVIEQQLRRGMDFEGTL